MPQQIYCPRCKWKPDASALWQCLPVCAHVWNTFETRGVCPRCGEKFEHTACLRCHEFSRHMDWYHDVDPLMEKQDEEGELIK
jgi:hypothetical protein